MDPKQLDAIERWNVLFTGLMVVVAALLFDRAVLIGITVGAVLSCANFYAIHKLLEKSMKAKGARRATLQVLLMLKMSVVLVLVFLAIKYLELSAPALAIGLSVFLLSIAVESVRFALSGGTGSKEENGRA